MGMAVKSGPEKIATFPRAKFRVRVPERGPSPIHPYVEKPRHCTCEALRAPYDELCEACRYAYKLWREAFIRLTGAGEEAMCVACRSLCFSPTCKRSSHRPGTPEHMADFEAHTCKVCHQPTCETHAGRARHKCERRSVGL